jgi:hypothetical protein
LLIAKPVHRGFDRRRRRGNRPRHHEISLTAAPARSAGHGCAAPWRTATPKMSSFLSAWLFVKAVSRQTLAIVSSTSL